jgi:hypothetical protein
VVSHNRFTSTVAVDTQVAYAVIRSLGQWNDTTGVSRASVESNYDTDEGLGKTRLLNKESASTDKKPQGAGESITNSTKYLKNQVPHTGQNAGSTQN